MNPAQPQPQSDWGKVLTMLPMLLGGAAALRGAPWGRVGGQMQPLPESTVRGPEGLLKKLYHGAPIGFADFQAERANPESLYGPGIYMTENPDIAAGYAKTQGPVSLWRPEEAQKYFQPGRLVSGYNGQDKVLQFDPGTADGSWRVQVQGVDAQGNPRAGELPRWHSTPPQVHEQNVRPVYADIKNPFDIEGSMPKTDAAKMLRSVGMEPAYQEALMKSRGDSIPNRRLYQELTLNFGGDKQLVNAVLQHHGYDGITHIGGGITGSDPHQVYIAFSDKQVYPTFGLDAATQALQQPRYMPGLSEILPRLSQPQPPQGQ
jgi:hypothetical protein